MFSSENGFAFKLHSALRAEIRREVDVKIMLAGIAAECEDRQFADSDLGILNRIVHLESAAHD